MENSSKKPVLLVLAAGLGSRYGGLKQLDPVGSHGQLIIDYSIYDAKRAGFEEVIFVIRPEMEEAFQSTIGARIGNAMKIRYAYQKIDDLPEGISVPEGRSKPWGTAHAVLAARGLISGPFATINADDFYGAGAYKHIFEFLSQNLREDELYQYGLVGYALKNTVTEHGSVARGVCQVDEAQHLVKIDERTNIVQGEGQPRYSLDEGESWIDLAPETIVSMNLWGFTESYLREAERGFQFFLNCLTFPEKSEYYLPAVADALVQSGRAQVTVLPSQEVWHGVTYPDDRPNVVSAIAQMTAQGLYPDKLWS